MAPPPVLNLAPGKTNTILNLPNMVRLPLGVPTFDPKPAGSSTWYWLTIPTDTGGTLRVEHDNGTVTLYAMDGTTKLGGGGPELDYTVKTSVYGIFYVLAEGNPNRNVTATFTQVSFARTGPHDTDPPLIPWNFYFWPASRVEAPEEAKQVLGMIEKFARVLGKDAKAARMWEYKHHQINETVGQEIRQNTGWTGHCHNAAAASILFEKPVAQALKGEALTVEELQFMATEWFGNYGLQEGRGLPDKSPATPPSFELKAGTCLHDDDAPLVFLTMCFRPGDKQKDAASLLPALKSYLPSPKWTDEERANAALRLFKTPNLEDTINRWFGELAAKFYACLVQRMRVEHHALVADLGGSRGDDPHQVWNHAVFYYKATFTENPEANDPEDVIVTIELVANAESRSTDPPAYVNVKENSVDLGSATLGNRRTVNVLRLAFQSGKIAMTDPRNKWIETHSAPGGAFQLYAPRYLAVLSPVGAKPVKHWPKDPDETSFSLDLDVGNPYIELEAVSGPSPLLKIRKRYQ